MSYQDIGDLLGSRFCLRRAAGMAGCALAFIGPATVTAQSVESVALEEIVVTAERRTSDIQDTAASISVRAGEDLAEQGRFSTRQILEDIPGITALDNQSLNVGSADVQGNNITIRGISPGPSAGGGPSSISATPATAVYVDGIYEGIGGNYDLERVEVLRGPQGTLYGRSATSGVVAFHTRNPSLEGFDANVAVELGNYDLRHYTGAVNVPLGGAFALRVSGDYRDQGEGYYGEADLGLRERTNGRVKALWQPNEALSVLVGFAIEKDDAFTGGNESSIDLARTVIAETSAIFPSHKESKQYWAEINWDLGPVTLTYLPALRSWEQDDHKLVEANFIGSGAPIEQFIQTPLDDFQTHELRVASNDDAMLRWQAGVFYYHNELRTNNRVFLSGAGGQTIALASLSIDDKDTKNLGYFAEGTIAFADSVRLTLGVRYDDTKVVVSEDYTDNVNLTCGTTVPPPAPNCTGPGQPENLSIFALEGAELKFHNFNYKARFEYDWTADNMVYAMVSTGFRPGDAGVANGAPNFVESEKLTSFEIGSKNRFLDGALQLNLGVYHYRYNGFHTSYTPDTANAYDPANIQAGDIDLVVPARNFGGELEVLYQLTARDRLGLNYNYVESRWVDKPADFAKAQPEDKRALTPHTFTANYEHTFELPGGSMLSARIDGKFEAAHRTQNLHADWLRLGLDQYVHVDDRTVGNLTGTWRSGGGRYSLAAYVRNFTGERYGTYVVQDDPQNFRIEWSDPRTYGVTLSAQF